MFMGWKTINMSILTKLMYRFNAIPINMTAGDWHTYSKVYMKMQKT